MQQKQNKIKVYGIVIGIFMLAFQHGVYLLANEIAGLVGITPILPKISLDYLIPIIPIFIVPYIWSYIFWAMAPMAVSKCEKEHFLNYMAAYFLALFIGGLILVFMPTYMDRVAEGLTDVSRTGIFAKLMRFWYTLDGGDMAYNLFPSFHCLNSTMAYLGIRKRPEIPKWFKVYTLITTILIFFSTVFVKQHFILDVFSGIAVALISYIIATKCKLGRYFKWLTAIFNDK